MNAPVTRRALLSATAAVGAVGLPALVVAAPADPDTVLLDLIRRHGEDDAAYERMGVEVERCRAVARAAYPERPYALRRLAEDFPRTGLGVGLSDDGGGEGERWYGFRGVEWMRNRPTSAWFPGRTSPFETGDEARRLEILAAWDRWQAERQAVDDAVGYTAASQAEFDALQAWNEADDAVKAYQPQTMAGLVRKAAWVADRLASTGCDDDLGEVFARQVATFGGTAS